MLVARRDTLRIFVLALATGLIALAMVALACGPAAPSGQDATPEPTATDEPMLPEATATTTTAATPNTATPTATAANALPQGWHREYLANYPTLDYTLRARLARHQAAQSNGASGQSPEPEVVLVSMETSYTTAT